MDAKQARRDVFIFVPAYNVERTLEGVLSKISPAILNRSRILVIDDGSDDGTRASFEHWLSERRESEAEIVCFEKNAGYGPVVKYGIARALESNANFIVCLHGDGQYPAEMIESLVEILEGTENVLVQGSRHASDGCARSGGMPLYKRIGGKFLTFVENLVFNEKMTDRHSGFIAYKSDFLKTVSVDKLSDSFDIDIELIAIADSSCRKMTEIPIPTCYAGEKSNLKVLPYGFRVLFLVIRTLFRRLHR